MSFEGLLGNERLKENLRMSVGRGRISHFYLISGPAGSGKHTLAKLLSAAILCQGERKPCLSCNACRKVMGNAHPDCITITDPDHKTVAVDIVRDARADMYVMPNESDRKVYIFPQELRIEGQNALLKILEEPPEYGVFILLSDNPEKLLPTVRSRCTELSLLALPENVMRQALKAEFPDADEESLTKWAKAGSLAVEMEAAALYLNAMHLKKRALAICTISDLPFTGEACTAEERQNTFTDMMKIALETAVKLDK